MRARLIPALVSTTFAALALGACTSVSGDEGETSDSTSASTTTSTGTGTEGGQEPPPRCEWACTTPEDCAQPSPSVDADNYACTDGACVYLGCKSDAECEVLGNFKCEAIGEIPICIQQCESAAECISPSADACIEGRCQSLGCASDDECLAGGTQGVCEIDTETNSGLCTYLCDTVADCDFGVAHLDADNFVCEAGVCEYLGCNSDEECAASGDFVCR